MAALLGLLRPTTVRPFAGLLLTLSALGFVLAGYLHARLFHEGFAHVAWVGPLFLLNAVGTLVVVLALIAGLNGLYVLGGLGISVGSIVSILISHTGSFLGFSEGAWTGDAVVIVAGEIAATVLILAAVGAGALRGEPRGARA